MELYGKVTSQMYSKLEEFFKWMNFFRKELSEGKLSEKVNIIISRGLSEYLLITSKWEETIAETDEIISKIKEYQKLNAVAHEKFQNSILEIDIISFKSLSSDFLKFLKPKYKKVKREILGCYNSRPPSNDIGILQDLECVFKLKVARENLKNIQSRGKDLFGTFWKNEFTDGKILEEFIKLMNSLKKQSMQGILSQNMLELLKVGIDQSVLTNNRWNFPSNEIEEIILKMKRYSYLSSHLETKFNNSIFEQDIDKLIFEIKRLCEMKKLVLSYYTSQSPLSDQNIISCIERINEFKISRSKLINIEDRGQILFGTYWKSEETDPQLLESLSKWILSFRKYLLDGALSEKVFDVSSTASKKEDLSSTVKSIIKTNDNLRTQRNSLFKLINAKATTIFGESFDEVSFEEMNKKLNSWKLERSLLVVWSQFINHRKQCLQTVAAPFVRLIDNDEILAKDLVNAFKGNYVDSLLKITFREKKILLEFVQELQDNKINKFKELDKKIISLNRQRIAYEAYCNKPDISSAASPDSEVGILIREFNRKRGHLPIRKLMTQSWMD